MEFAEWKATYRIEPWGDDWRQAAYIAAEVHNAGAKQWAAALAAGGQETKIEFRNPTDYIPYARRSKPKTQRRRTAEESEAAARERYG